MATADDFLEAAQTLVDHPTQGSGHFRRAISTAYFAAFHTLVESATDVFFASPGAKVAAREWFEHGRIASVAQVIRDVPTDPSKQANWIKDNGSSIGFDHVVSAAHRLCCERLRALYTKRQQADYFNPKALGLTSVDARSAIDAARAVCDQVREWQNSGDPDFELMALAMLRRSVNAKNR